MKSIPIHVELKENKKHGLLSIKSGKSHRGIPLVILKLSINTLFTFQARMHSIEIFNQVETLLYLF
jgi:hypothetical protein